MGLAFPGSTKYERLPMRIRLRLFWIGVMMTAAAYETHKLFIVRVMPKRSEQQLMLIDEYTKGDLPEEAIDELHRKREMRETMSLSNVLRVPLPNEISHALRNEYDPRRLAALRSDNGN